ncbi:unnamed protein product [Periconia digitata]|uniref:Uncharacterized protein n=1 Tax=Periconia digitata TaxID=1303443 RepID=A0A9W4XEY6_9PLEO|nr:unnamed protein product [Periconia digitata]
MDEVNSNTRKNENGNKDRNLREKVLNPFKRCPPPVPKYQNPFPKQDIGWLNRLVFQWIQPIITTGFKRPVNFNDVWLVDEEQSCEVLVKELDASLLRRRKSGTRRPLLWALYDIFKWQFLLGGFYHLAQSISNVMSPFLMRYLILFAQKTWRAHQTPGEAPPPVGQGIGILIGLFALGIARSVCSNHFQHYGALVGAQSRTALIGAIYNKTLKLSGRARAGGEAAEVKLATTPPSTTDAKKPKFGPKWRVLGLSKEMSKLATVSREYPNGAIINLMSTDTYRIDQGLALFHMLWGSLFSILLTLVLLIINLSYYALAGFSLLLILAVVLTRTAQSFMKRRVAINKITDQRVSLTYEIVQAVRLIKYYSWETPFLDRINVIRQQEIASLQLLMAIKNFVNATSASVPVFSCILCFVAYSKNNILEPASVFSSVALFNGLRLPLNILPTVMSQVIDAISSIERISEYLGAEEISQGSIWDATANHAIEVQCGNFTWEQSQCGDTGNAKGTKTPANGSPTAFQEPFRVADVNLTILRAELVAVIGTVGAGKSSLLSALAGEMRKTAGSITIGSTRRAICPEQPWIQNATLRANVLFGRQWDAALYENIIDACALREDINLLVNGDLTEIGERGITLSGGQKQRVSIARAMYSNADLLLFDSPFSAVDAHVRHHILENAICGPLLKDKTRIVATHQLDILHRCDRILWIEDGRLVANDTFPNLIQSNEAFAKLLTTNSTTVDNRSMPTEEIKNVDAGVQTGERKKTKEKSKTLMANEERVVKPVSWNVYDSYAKAAGGYTRVLFLFVLLVLSQASAIATTLWLAFWTAQRWSFPLGIRAAVYLSLGILQILTVFLFAFGISTFGTRASRNMLHSSLDRVLHAPMTFFDTTPTGRITNRLCKDIDIMDNNLTESLRALFTTVGIVVGTLVLITAYFPYFAIPTVPLLLVCYCTIAYYRNVARDLKRLEAIQRSFVFTSFGEVVNGAATIRAYGVESHFLRSLYCRIDDMNSINFPALASQRWLGIRLDAVGNAIILIVGLLIILHRSVVNPSFVGLVLSHLLAAVQLLQFGARQMTEVENNMNATERVHYYVTQLEQEEPKEPPPHVVSETWPDKGEIIFRDIHMRYREGLPLVLKDFNLHIMGGERIGIIGRTGAGKSSVLNALFRMVNLSSGTISVDGIDITDISLKTLRSRISIIPQDPVLFRGTIRSNLDPFNQHSDHELWNVLRQVSVTSNPSNSNANRITPDSIVDGEGLNFSLGQRQLLTLARALLRQSRIIVCDEATSSVDGQTDQQIQEAMLKGFAGKTLLCIAHRLNTVLTYDRIAVVERGGVVEIGKPKALFELGGAFRGMCDQSGITKADFGVGE